MGDIKDIPSIPDAVDPDLRRSLVRMREVLQRLIGTIGNDPALTQSMAASLGAGGTTIVLGGSGSGGGGSGSYTPDLTPPPSPTALTIAAGFTQVTVQWSGITYTQGHGNKQTRIYAVKRDPADTSTPPTFSDAQMVATAPQALTIISIPSEPNTRWFVWAKFESVDGVLSVSPAGGTNGVQDTTGQDVTQLLTVLSGQITQSQLFTDLSTTVDLVGQLSRDAGLDSLNALQAALAANQVEQRASTALASAQQTLTTTINQGLSAEATARLLLTATVGDVQAGLISEQTTRASADSALADSITILTASVGTNTAAISAESTARSSADSALASSISTLSVTVGANTTAISTEASTRATQTGQLFAEYTVKIDQNGFVTGYGLASTANNSTPTSQFLVRADQFAVAPPTNYSQEAAPTSPTLNQLWFQPSTGLIKRWDGTTWQPFGMLPFVVQATPTTEGGVAIPAGVYMNAAYLINLTATYGRIQSLVADQITAADVSVSQLTAGNLRVGGYLRSTAFTSGSAGWTINADGTAEFANAIVRGTIYAQAANIIGTLTAGQIASVNADTIIAGSIRSMNITSSTLATAGSYLTSSTAGGDTTVNVKNTADFPASGNATVIDPGNDGNTFSYTGKTASTLTGCSGVGAHPVGMTVVPMIKSMVIDKNVNELRFYGDRGDGVIEELAFIGTSTATGFFTAQFGSPSASANRGGVLAYGSGGSNAIGASTTPGSSGVAVYAASGNARHAVYVAGGAAGGEALLRLDASAAGHALLTPIGFRPTLPRVGALSMLFTTGGSAGARTATPRLCYMDDAGNWRFVSTDSIFTG